MLSSRTIIIFLAVAALIVAAVFTTTSMVSVVPLVGEKPVNTTDFQSINPELRVEQRYADMMAKPTSVLWVANPELNTVDRFAEIISSVSYSANPELLVADRYGAKVFNVLTSSFLATNPEIIAHLRYTADD